MNKITAILVVKNAPQYLFESINSIEDFVSEIIIVDIGMDPKIKDKIKQMKTILLVEIKKEVVYVEAIREDLKRYATQEYILFLDPDEILTVSLKKTLSENLIHYDFFSIPRKNIIFCKWMKHSRWWPDYQIRIFRKEKVVWPKEIHFQPKTLGEGLKIEAKEEFAIIHHNYKNVDEFFNKMIRYAKVEAHNLIEKKRLLTLDETIKKSISEFISRYFAAEGYKDGMHGFSLAMLQMFYCFLVYFYYWEDKKYTDLENGGKKTYFQINDYFKQGSREINHWLRKKKLVKGIYYIKKWVENIF